MCAFSCRMGVDVDVFMCVCVCAFACERVRVRMCIYIYIYSHPPTTCTPLKSTVTADTNAVFSESNFGAVSTDWKHKCKTQESKNPNIQKSKNQNFSHLRNLASFFGFWIFGCLVF